MPQVIAYRVLSGALEGDYIEGHGTHVAGSIAGNANLAPSLLGGGGRTRSHNGAAPHAKLVVDDLCEGLGEDEGGLPGLSGLGLDPVNSRA